MRGRDLVNNVGKVMLQGRVVGFDVNLLRCLITVWILSHFRRRYFWHVHGNRNRSEMLKLQEREIKIGQTDRIKNTTMFSFRVKSCSYSELIKSR